MPNRSIGAPGEGREPQINVPPLIAQGDKHDRNLSEREMDGGVRDREMGRTARGRGGKGREDRKRD